jgi:transposase
MAHRLFVRPLTRAEQQELARLVRTGPHPRVVRRAQMIRMSAQGHPVARIAEAWGVHPQTVRRTIKAFDAEGPAALADKPRPGRPPKATARYVACLKEAVATSPRDLGYPFSSWTLARLREHLARRTGTVLHPAYLSGLMAREGIVYRRPKHVMAHLRNPQDYDEKKALLAFLKNAPSGPRPPLTSCSSTNVRFTSTRP